MGLGHVNNYLWFKGTVPGAFGSKLEWYLKNPYYLTGWRGWYMGVYINGPAGDRSGFHLEGKDGVMRMSRSILDAIRTMEDGSLDMLDVVHVDARRTQADGSSKYAYDPEESFARALPAVVEDTPVRQPQPVLPGWTSYGPAALAAMRRRWPHEPPKVFGMTDVLKHVGVDGTEVRADRTERTACAFFRPFQWAAAKASLVGMCEGALMCGDAPDRGRCE